MLWCWPLLREELEGKLPAGRWYGGFYCRRAGWLSMTAVLLPLQCCIQLQKGNLELTLCIARWWDCLHVQLFISRETFCNQCWKWPTVCIGCTMTSAQCSQLPDSIFPFLVPSGGENLHFLAENRESLLASPAVRKGETFKQHEERLTINRLTSDGKTDAVSQEHPGLQNSPGSGVVEATWMWALPLYAGMCSFGISNDMKIWSIMNMLMWITE